MWPYRVDAGGAPGRRGGGRARVEPLAQSLGMIEGKTWRDRGSGSRPLVNHVATPVLCKRPV